MSEENVELGHRVFEGVNRSGFDGMLPFLDPQVEWHTDPSVPEPGVYRGREGVADYVRGLFSLTGGTVRFEVERIVSIPGDRIFCQVTAYSTPEGSGREVALMDWCLIGTVHQGRIAAIHSYLRLDEALEAAGLSE